MKRGTCKEKKYVEENFWEKIEKVGKRIPFLRDAIALYKYIKDPKVHWARKSIPVGALAYFIWPLDAIPDMALIVGYLDDAGVIAAVVSYLKSELKPYYE